MTPFYERMYRLSGIRDASSLTSPTFTNIEGTNLPRGSHLILSSVKELELVEKMMDPKKAKILVHHQLEYPTGVTVPMSGFAETVTSIVSFHKEHPSLLRVKDPSAKLVDSRGYVVTDLGYLDKIYREARTPAEKWARFEYKGIAVQDIITDKVTVGGRKNTEKFLMLRVPETLPKTDLLIQGFKHITAQTYETIGDFNAYLYRELILWSYSNGTKSIFAVVSPTDLEKTTLILEHNGRYKFLNLIVIWMSMPANKDSDYEPATIYRMPQMSTGVQMRAITAIFYQVANNAIDEDESEELSNPVPAGEPSFDEDGDEVETPNKAEDGPELGISSDNDVEVLSDAVDRVSSYEAVDVAALISEISDGEILKALETPSDEENVVKAFKRVSIGKKTDEASLKAILAELSNSKELLSPYSDASLVDEINNKAPTGYTDEEIAIHDSPAVFDKTMLVSTVDKMDGKYVKFHHRRLLIGATQAFRDAGMIVSDYRVERKRDYGSDVELHTLQIKPAGGSSSVIQYRIPVIDEDGRFRTAGSTYRMRKQSVDLPIRKISANVVALSSAYGKLFIERARVAKRSQAKWLETALSALALQSGGKIRVTAVPCYVHQFNAPKLFTQISHSVSTILTPNYIFNFNVNSRVDGEGNMYWANMISPLEKDGMVICGVTIKGNSTLLLGKDGVLYSANKGEAPVLIGGLLDTLGIAAEYMPTELCEVRVLGKQFPVVFVLGFLIGLSKVIKMYDLSFTFVKGRGVVPPTAGHEVVKFKDGSIVFKLKGDHTDYLVAGLSSMSKYLKTLPYTSMDTDVGYSLVLNAMGLTARYLTEMELLDKLFVDPLTREILTEMKEPKTFKTLLMRSLELIYTETHPHTADDSKMRKRGYDRFSSFVYQGFVASIKGYYYSRVPGKKKVDMDPWDIWRTITADETVEIPKGINPIQYLKEKEAVTFAGEGGRSKDSFNSEARKYTGAAFGILSEANVDNGDVGINVYMSANPNIGDVYGISAKKEVKVTTTNILSTSALLAPQALHDDPKRINYISIQQGHTVACEGYSAPAIRTGYESVIPHRMSKLYAYHATGVGVVKSVNDKGIIIQYQDGELEGANLGKVYEKSDGKTYQYKITTDLKAGERVKKGQPVAWNTAFFVKDWFNPGSLVLKLSLTVRAAFMESLTTYEDSTAISPKLSVKMSTTSVKVKSALVSFESNVLKALKVGAEVTPDDVLFYEDKGGQDESEFAESDAETLMRLNSKTLKAGSSGHIEKVEVIYFGKLGDMSPGLKKMAVESDKEMVDASSSVEADYTNGSVDGEYRYMGAPIPPNSAEIRYYITHRGPHADADKMVVMNQLKSTASGILPMSITGKDGKEIELCFSWKGVEARGANSPIRIGTTLNLLEEVGARAFKLYFGK